MSPEGFFVNSVTRFVTKIMIRAPYIDQKKRALGKHSWCVETNIGKRKRKYFKTRTEAYAYKNELYQYMLEGTDESSSAEHILLSTALSKHLANLTNRGAREETITSRRVKCTHFVKHCRTIGLPRLSNISRQVLKDYILSKNKESTRMTTRSEVGGFLNWCHENDLTPTHFYKVKWEHKLEDEKLVETLTVAEAKELMEAIPDSYKVAMALMLFAGIRPYEVPRIKWELVYPDKNLIIIEGISAKTRKVRKLTDLPPNLWAWIKKYKSKSMGDKGPINRYRVFHKHRKKACVKCGIVFPHDGARHSFGSYGYWFGGKPWAMRLMGHSNESVFNAHYLDTGISKNEAENYFRIIP